MQTQLKVIQIEQSKGKLAGEMSIATDELQYLLNFNLSISQCMAKTIEHLSNFVFICMVNITVARRDSYVTHMKSGIKQDTLSALRQAPLHMATLFPDNKLKKVDIAQYNNKGQPSSSSHKKGRYNPYGKTIGSHDHGNKSKGKFSCRPAKGQALYE